MSAAMLQVSRLNKRFGGVAANTDVSLDVRPGEAHAVIGPNGAGKTTLVSQLSGELAPDSGRILFEGADITGRPAHARCRLGLARSFQTTSVFRDMTALENVAMAVQAHDGHSFRFWRKAMSDPAIVGPARGCLDRVGLGERARTAVGVMSHGEHRQLEIAMALASEPRLLLLDEPMAGMGAEESARMVEILGALKGDKTLLLIEHDMDAVFALADRVSVLVDGRVIVTDEPGAVRANESVRRAYLGEEAA